MMRSYSHFINMDHSRVLFDLLSRPHCCCAAKRLSTGSTRTVTMTESSKGGGKKFYEAGVIS